MNRQDEQDGRDNGGIGHAKPNIFALLKLSRRYHVHPAHPVCSFCLYQVPAAQNLHDWRLFPQPFDAQFHRRQHLRLILAILNCARAE